MNSHSVSHFILTLFRMGHFMAPHGFLGGGGGQKEKKMLITKNFHQVKLI